MVIFIALVSCVILILIMRRLSLVIFYKNINRISIGEMSDVELNLICCTRVIICSFVY